VIDVIARARTARERAVKQRFELRDVQVIRTNSDTPQDERLLLIADQLTKLFKAWAGTDSALEQGISVAIERPFLTEHNPDTAMGTAQVAGLAMVEARRLLIETELFTPTQVKLAVTGNGQAPKQQIGNAVAHLLGLERAPKPADAADALAIALTSAIRGGSAGSAGGGAGAQARAGAQLTPAQKLWKETERASRRSTTRKI
jgi:crossover junction endodeoxyribonuclease RuvC